MCVKCGVPTELAQSHNNRSRTVAVVLAIFFGAFSWLYTFERDAKKFWIGLAFYIAATLIAVFVEFGILGTALDCINTQHNCGQSAFREYLGLWCLIAVLALGMHVWALVDAARKSDHFYKLYPHG
jgi:hypothetical protein